ncbi:MAG: Omp28-related outer membrane protein [Chitinophagaceae bacterium]|nr:Omp28-related outer membrane protein [Chitinophagaceae bacterium]
MKNLLSISSIAIVLFTLSCKEQTPPGLVLNNSGKAVDSSYTAAIETPQVKKIVMEELTGVQCVNCPEKGSEAIETLMNANPNRIIPIAIHTGSFTDPHVNSKYDFRVPDGESVATFLGGESGKPSSSVDRIADANNIFIRFPSEWSGIVAAQKNKTTPVNIHMTSEYNEAQNMIDVIIKTAFTSNVTEDLNLSLYVVENDIKDVQSFETYIDTAYIFKHVFRKSVTSVQGSPLNFAPKIAGNVLQKRISFEPITTGVNKWNLDNCHLVGIISKASTKEVLHAEEIPMK